MSLKSLMCWVILFSPLVIYCQERSSYKKINFDFTVSLGNSLFTNLLNGTTHQLSPQVITQINCNVTLKNYFYLKTGIGYESNRHLVDGYFSKSGNNYTYQQVPFNYTQNEILLDYLNLPLLIKKDFNKNNESSFNLGIGPIFGYLVNATQKTKINGIKTETNAPVENKFRYGLCLDFDRKTKVGKMKSKGVFGWGLYYQLSHHLKDGKSFQPLTAYFKFGIGT